MPCQYVFGSLGGGFMCSVGGLATYGGGFFGGFFGGPGGFGGGETLTGGSTGRGRPPRRGSTLGNVSEGRARPGTRLDVLDGCTNRGNWVPVLVNFAVEPRFAGSGSSHQFFFRAITEF